MLHVQAATELEAAFERSGGGFELRGHLHDDRGDGIGPVELVLATRSGRLRAVPCQASRLRVSGSGRQVRLTTDDEGRFCAWLPWPKSSDKSRASDKSRTSSPSPLRLRFRGLGHYAPSGVRLQPHVQASHSLGFDAHTETLSLDIQRHRVGVTIVPPSDTAATLTLELVDSRGRTHLSKATVAAGQSQATLSVASADLGHAGPAQLTATLAASSGEPIASARVRVQRTALVSFESAEWVPSPAGPRLRVQLASSGGPVGAGGVRVRQAEGDQTARVARGQALIVLPRPPEAAVELSYIPSDAWWLAPPPIQVPPATFPLSRKPTVGWLWWAFFIPVGFLGWRALQRPGPPRRKAGRARSAPRPASSDLPLPLPDAPWPSGQGQVLDAHTGRPIVDAQVELVVPTMEGPKVTAVARSNAAGLFQLDPGQLTQRGALVRAEGEQHSMAQAIASPAGPLRIRLSSRRRSLLARLAESARALKHPTTTDPTPGDLIRWADARSDAQTAAWSQRLQQAAFGPLAPDRAMEVGLTESRPRPTRSSGPGGTVDGQ